MTAAEHLSNHPPRWQWTALGTVIGGVATLSYIGALDDLLKVALGGAVGWLGGLIAFVVYTKRTRQRHVLDLRDRPRDELLHDASAWAIDGRATMNKEELAQAIAGNEVEFDDPVAEVVSGLVDEASQKVKTVVVKARAGSHRRRPRSNGNGSTSNGSNGSNDKRYRYWRKKHRSASAPSADDECREPSLTE